MRGAGSLFVSLFWFVEMKIVLRAGKADEKASANWTDFSPKRRSSASDEDHVSLCETHR